MDNLLIIVLAVIDAMVALLLIAVVLVQQSKDGGFGGSPFGGAGDAVFGGQAADHLTKITVGLAAVFLILTLSLAIITGRRTSDEKSVVENAPPPQSELAPLPKPETPKQVKRNDLKIIDDLDGVSKKSESVEKAAETVEKKAGAAKKNVDKPTK
ncbi:MAG: preprotein translocase subunit SecG [Kiritimatiellaeota bacterium]|nr:preprotein translocase subunit SecG [Kiritimatiellota bacterium]